jgi:hypothetical protein
MITATNILDNGMVELTFVRCPNCEMHHGLTVRQDELMDYYASGDVMKSFPRLLAFQRELFMTGIGGDCFRQVFQGGEY